MPSLSTNVEPPLRWLDFRQQSGYAQRLRAMIRAWGAGISECVTLGTRWNPKCLLSDSVSSSLTLGTTFIEEKEDEPSHEPGGLWSQTLGESSDGNGCLEFRVGSESAFSADQTLNQKEVTQ